MNASGPLADRRDGLPGARDRVPSWVGRLVAALSFWAAIVLPVFYLSLLVAGIEDTAGLRLFLLLLAAHVVTLIGGRSFRANSSR